jgi:hypothetical protein
MALFILHCFVASKAFQFASTAVLALAAELSKCLARQTKIALFVSTSVPVKTPGMPDRA